MQITNVTGIQLPLAVWLATDGYDFYRGTRRAISATGLLKGTRKILLGERLDEGTATTPDLTSYIPSRLGHTIHDGIEKAWKGDYVDSMRKLGYPEKLIRRIAINPTEVGPDTIPIWIEQRFEREIMGYAVTGKFDMILEGVIQDFKSTSVYSMISGSKEKDFQLQGSIYRWLNPEKATADHMVIHFIFTDWSKAQSRQSNDYPQQRVMSHRVELLSLPETEAWIKAKLRALEASADLPEDQLPRCTPEDLWMGPSVWKYWLDPAKAGVQKSSKNSDSYQDALDYQASKGGRGVIIEVPGKPRACAYCPAFPICSQKDEYDHG